MTEQKTTTAAEEVARIEREIAALRESEQAATARLADLDKELEAIDARIGAVALEAFGNSASDAERERRRLEERRGQIEGDRRLAAGAVKAATERITALEKDLDAARLQRDEGRIEELEAAREGLYEEADELLSQAAKVLLEQATFHDEEAELRSRRAENRAMARMDLDRRFRSGQNSHVRRRLGSYIEDPQW